MVAHGALDHAELAVLGLQPAALVDFSSNLNPFGPPAAVGAALAALDPAPYPDRSCHQLRIALAERHSYDSAAILAGNGANELIHLVARALLRPGDVTLVIGPTFGEYAHASRLSGAEVIEWCAHETQNFTVELELDHIAARIAWLRPRLTWLCTPNNPTGVDLPPDAIVMLAETCAAVGGLLVVDRAYGSFLRGTILAGDPLDGVTPANVLRLYSLTKSYAIAGLRLGYLLAEAELIGQVAAFQPTWSVSSAALAAGLAALADDAFLSATLPQIWACSDTLRDALVDLGLSVHRADLPFMLVRSGDAVATRLALIRSGCVVRDCTSFGLPAWVRVAPRRPAENARLIGAWKECL